jgi:hypothetical protein
MAEEEKGVLGGICERLKKTIEAWQTQYQLSISEINFLSPANQWPEDAKAARVGKPTIASDRLNAQVKQICNQQRDNRPAICYHAVNNQANADVANIWQGIARHVEVQSKADLAYDTGFEHAVQGGIGFLRLMTEYKPGTFDQRMKIVTVPNPFMVYIDPSFAEVDGSDIRYAFVMDLMSEDEFKEEYGESNLGNKSFQSWAQIASRFPEWFDMETKATMVIEYYEKTHEKYTLCKLKSGKVMDKADCTEKQLKQIAKDPDGKPIERDDYRPVVKWYKLCAPGEILEETEWIGDDIPIIPIFGDIILDNGNRVYSGLVRNTKEEQVMLNTIKTVILEMIARSPKNPWLVAEGSIDDHKDEWASVNVLDLPYLTFKTKVEGDDNPLPMPQRQTAEAPIQNMMAVAQMLENDIKATSAIFDPTLGEKMANDQSGIAIKALQNAGNVAHYNFSDNLTRALRVLGKQMLDVGRKIMTEPEVIHILGIGDNHQMVGVNGADQPEDGGELAAMGKVFDLSVGEYDVTVDSGPSYQTKRQENLNMLTQLAMKNPAISNYCMDLIVGLMDFPESTELRKRLEKLLPPALQPIDQQNKPDPQALQQQLAQAHQMIQQLSATLQKETALADTEQTRLQVAQLQAQTELTKQKTQLGHDANKTLLEAQMEELKLKGAQSHEILTNLQKHLLAKDQAVHEAALGQVVAAAQPPEPAQPAAVPTNQSGNPTPILSSGAANQPTHF